MFWSLILEPGKKYTSTVKESFHLSMATLDVKTAKTDNEIYPVQLIVKNQELLICNLSKPLNLQVSLDLMFEKGTEMTFSTSGKATIHLTGYVIDDSSDEHEDYSDSEDETTNAKLNKIVTKMTSKSDDQSGKNKDSKKNSEKRKLESDEVKVKKKAKFNEDSSEDEENESDSSGDLDGSDLDKLDMTFSDEDDDDDDEEDDEGDDDENETASDTDDEDDIDIDDSSEDEKTPTQQKPQIKTPVSNKKKDGKQDKFLVQKLMNGATPQSEKKEKNKNKNSPKSEIKTPKGEMKTPKGEMKTPKGEIKTPKSEMKTPKGEMKTPKSEVKTPKGNESTPSAHQSPKKQTVEGGVVIEELKPGNGPVAKPGRMVAVYYTGRLKNNNRVFDQTNNGPGFKFRLGKGEVIRAWDVALSGMKVGSKRRITCPPNMAYGNKGSPPSIPPNSTLVFDVELKSVN